MKIITRDFGETEIDEKTIITMPNGIIGFEDVKRYTLLSPLGEVSSARNAFILSPVLVSLSATLSTAFS